MAIAKVLLGTGSIKTDQSNCTIDIGPTLAVGDWVVVTYAGDADALSIVVSDAGAGGAELELVENVVATNAGNAAASIWSGKVITESSGYVVAKFEAGVDARAITAYQVTGLDDTPFDKSSTGTGTGTTASSGATAALSQADEIAFGCIAAEDEIDDQNGTWTAGAGNVSGNEQATGTNGGGDASNISVYAAGEIVSATTAQTAEVTGMDSIDWAACVATYKGAVAAGPTGIKTINDLAIASVKTINDEPIAEVKTIQDAS